MTGRAVPCGRYRYILLPSLLIVLLFLVPPPSAAPSAETEGGGVITLDEYIRMVSARHPLFEGQSLSIDIEESIKGASLGAGDWTLRAASGYSRSEGILGGIEPELSEEYASHLSMERSIWRSGGRIKAQIDNGYTRSEFDPSLPFNIGPTEVYESRGTLSYSQPLLKNRGGTLDRLQFDLAGHSVELAKLQALENQEDFTLSVALKFMDWVLLSERMGIARRRLTLAGAQLKEISAKRKSNLVDEIDRLRAIDSREIARANLHLAEADWKAQRAELAILAGSDDLYKTEPVFDIYTTGLPGAPRSGAFRAARRLKGPWGAK